MININSQTIYVREKYERGECYTLRILAHATRIQKMRIYELKPPNPDYGFSERKMV